jgi:predicted ATP-grasp superfamily ATP-dependent carboligase
MDVKKNLLLVGIDNVHLAYSAKNAGYKVFVADYFGDVDLRRLSDGLISVLDQKPHQSSGRFEENYEPKAFINIVEKISKNNKLDGILLSSGLDDSYTILDKLNDKCKIIGNPPKTINRIRNKEIFFEELKRLRIIHPKTLITRSLEAAKKVTKDIGFPVILKPLKGFAGAGIKKVNNKKQLVKEYERSVVRSNERIIIQEYIKGTPASISFLANYHRAEIVAFNEQLIGLENTYQPEPFGYCGNITPFLLNNVTIKRCEKIIEKITSCFNLMGSNGVDLVISEDNTPYVIEVNPRFQGSIGCVERVYDINLVKMHLAACLAKKLPKKRTLSSFYSTRLILYTPKRLVAPDLVSKPNITDIPYPSSIIEKGEPFCSIISNGATKNESLYYAHERAKSVLDLASDTIHN